MPYRCELIDSVIHLELQGTVSGEELAAAFNEIEETEARLGRMPNRITYMAGLLQTDLDYRVMDGLVMRRRQKQFPNSFRTALVAPNPISYGFARMFQSLNNNPQIEIRIFSDERAALAWVADSQAD